MARAFLPCRSGQGPRGDPVEPPVAAVMPRQLDAVAGSVPADDVRDHLIGLDPTAGGIHGITGIRAAGIPRAIEQHPPRLFVGEDGTRRVGLHHEARERLKPEHQLQTAPLVARSWAIALSDRVWYRRVHG